MVLDVLAYFDETTEEFVRRRHRELQSGGLVNTEIFERIAAELPHRAVAPPELSLAPAAPHRLRLSGHGRGHRTDSCTTSTSEGQRLYVRNRRIHRQA